MKNSKGFTLLELLVAATIIGIMAVFATTSYKNSAADARVAAAKTRTEALAGAVQRMRFEYPAFKSVSGQMTDVDMKAPSTIACNTNAASGLISCGFLGNNGWNSDQYMQYFVCNGKTGDCANSPVSDPLACMVSRNNSKMPDRYLTGYIYCVSAVDKSEKLAAGS